MNGNNPVEKSHPLEENIGAVESCQKPFVLRRTEVEIGGQTSNARIADI